MHINDETYQILFTLAVTNQKLAAIKFLVNKGVLLADAKAYYDEHLTGFEGLISVPRRTVPEKAKHLS